MSLTIDGIALSQDLLWADEFTSWRVGQVIKTTVTGARIVQESALQAGRPITLETTQDGTRWTGIVSLAQLLALKESEAAMGTFAVTLPAHNSGTRTFFCRWRNEGGAAIEARAVHFLVPYIDGDWFAVTLRLIQVD